MTRAGAGVFVCGSPYTEVSSVAWALSAHPGFMAAPESRFLFHLFGSRPGMERPYLYDAYCRCREGGTWLDVNGCPYDEFVAALGEGIARLFQSRTGERRWVDSSPENALLGDDLLRLFPAAFVIGLQQPVRTAAFIEGQGRLPQDPLRLQVLQEVNTLYNKHLARLAEYAPSHVFLLEEAELFGDPDRLFSELFDFVGEPDDPTVSPVFASHLYRVNMPLAEAKAVLAEFSAASLTNGLISE
jgi:hypothetical protein